MTLSLFLLLQVPLPGMPPPPSLFPPSLSSLPLSPLSFLPHAAVTRPYYDFLLRQKHPSLPSALAQQQVFMLAEPKRKTTFWHNIGRLTPFKK